MKSNPETGAHLSHDFVRYSQAHFGASLGLRITIVANGYSDRLEMATNTGSAMKNQPDDA
jgi:hypothetical protein